MNERSCDRSISQAAAMAQVWLVPVPFFSHVLAFTKLARLLGDRRYGLRITLFVAPADLERLQRNHRSVLQEWEERRLDIQLRELQSPGYELATNDSQRFLVPFLKADEAFISILTRDSQTEMRPTCIVADIWFPAARGIATELKIPCWTYSSFMAGYVSAVMYIARMEALGMLNLSDYTDEAMKREAFCVPGLPVMKCADLCSEFFPDFGLRAVQMKNGPSMLQSEVILFSGFQELETKQHRELIKLLKIYAATEEPQVLHIGPTIPFLSHETSPSSNGHLAGHTDEHECVKFLNKQEPKSVLYVAFGCDSSHTTEQLVEVAHGLEDSLQPFICILCPPVGENSLFSVLPEDVVERTRERGMFLDDWVPQIEILAHPSTGGFMSHCGWNSVQESISLGVPILAWPFQYEQMMNCRFLVDAELAFEVSPDLQLVSSVSPEKSMKPVGRATIAETVRTLFRTEEGAALRRRTSEMQRKAQAAVGETGSSANNLRSIVDQILSLARSSVLK